MDDKSAQRQKAHETVISIAIVSKGLHSKLSRPNSSLERLSAHTRLGKIVAAANSILESSANDAALDPRLEDWLCSKEPKMCLHILSNMNRLIGTDLDGGTVWSRFRSALDLYSEARITETMKLFNDGQDFFHFLLTPQIWNCEVGATSHRSQPGTSVVRRVVNSASHEGPTDDERLDPEKLDAVVKWLDGFNCNGRHENVVSLRQPDTCTWLPGTDRYQAWKNRDNSFLWLQGKPGAGKTVLAASVIEGIKKTPQEGECIVFFYCDFRDGHTTSAATVMRSILSQLLRNLRNTTGQDLIQLVNDLIKEKIDSTSVLKHARRAASFVSRAARQFSRQPFVVIDALDECEDVENLLDALRKLASDGMHLFVTGRPLQVIKDKFHDLPSISMDKMAREVSADIRLHVTREVDGDRRLRILEEELKKEILATLQDKADGMFRWVQCQIDALRKCPTAKKIRSILLSLPTGLDETYERILRGIDPESSEEARRTLDWLVAALRPIHSVEILEALSIDLQRRKLDYGIAPVHGRALLDALGSLVVYDEESDIIKLSHFSVKEYLIGTSDYMRLSVYHIDMPKAHVQVALLCMCYIAAVLKNGVHPQTKTSSQVPSGQQADIVEVLSKSHPLLSYSLRHGFHHLQHVGSGNHAVMIDGMIALRSDIKHHPVEWQLICGLAILPYPFPSTGHLDAKHDFVVCILISLLPEQFLLAFLRRAPFKAFDGTSPLIYAAYYNKIEHARILLSRGVSRVNVAGLGVESPSQLLPLEVAFRHCHHSLFDLFLLDWEATAPPWLFSYVLYEKRLDFNTCDATKLLQLDKFAEWASYGQHRHLLHALHTDWFLIMKSASKKDIVAILRRLAQVGCNLSGPNSLEFIFGIIFIAVFERSLSMLVDLCSLDVPIPSRALFIGATLGREISGRELIEMLALRGLHMNTIMSIGNTALHHVFGECRHGFSCWAPNCDPCSVFLRALTLPDCVPQAADMLFVGRKGVGKSYLIDMVLSIPSVLPGSAQVTNRNDLQITCYATLLKYQLIQIWDTPGFDTVLDGCHLRDQVSQWLLQVSSSHSLKSGCSTIQVICCMNAREIGDPAAWKQFRTIHEECCQLGVTLVVLINQLLTHSSGDWEVQCRGQLKRLGVSTDCALLKSVRSHQELSSLEYKNDSRALCQLIEECSVRLLGNQSKFYPLVSHFGTGNLHRCRWVTIHPETGPDVCNRIVCEDNISEHLTRSHGLSPSGKVSCQWEGCDCKGDVDGEQLIRHIWTKVTPTFKQKLAGLFRRHWT